MSTAAGGARTHSAPWDCVLSKEEEGECRPGARPASDQQVGPETADYFLHSVGFWE